MGASSLFVLVAEGTNALNTTDEQFTMITNESVPVIDKILEAIDTQTKQGIYQFKAEKSPVETHSLDLLPYQNRFLSKTALH